MAFDGVVFDLDGTLVNSLEDIADSMNSVLQRNGFPTHDLQAYKYFIGNGLKNLVRKALPEEFEQDNELIVRCFDTMMDIYRNNCINKTRPYNGIAELLDELAERRKRLAVFSNKVDELTKIVVENKLPNWNFEVVIGSRADIPRKPNPTGALIISERMGIAPQKLLYVGDTDVDMQTANRAGMFAVGAVWGFRSKEELIINGAKYLLNHPLDLIQILK